MPLRWKIFKALAILQLLFVTFKLFTALVGLFMGEGFLLSLLDVFTYALMLAFVTLGFTVVNYNFPETPLSTKRKRWFNYLFLLNFLLIAVLFAKSISDWRLLYMLFGDEFAPWPTSTMTKFYYYFLVLHNNLIFLLHLYLLYSMYRLRKEIYSNSEGTWVKEFKDETPR